MFYELAVMCLQCVLWAGGGVDAVFYMSILRAGSCVPAVCSTGWQLCAGGVFYVLVIVCLRLFYGQVVVGL